MINEFKSNANPDPNFGANLEAIDRILSTDDQLLPSSGFVSAVMERVREESVAPPPIPFPWKRMLPGFVLAAGVFGWGVFELFRYAPHALGQLSFVAPHLSAAATRDLTQAGWVALACLVSLLSWLLAQRLAGQSKLI
jgi:hypothetical protein